MINRILPLLALVFSLSVQAQKLRKADRQIVENLRSHIGFLADDKLEGRRAGTAGEKLAREYIRTQFEKIGLKPASADGSWFQSFDIYDGRSINTNTFLIINDTELKLMKDFFPLSFSGNGSSEAAAALALRESSVPWFQDLDELVKENANNPHYDIYTGIHTLAELAEKKGATALILFNGPAAPDNIRFEPKDNSEKVKIPVLYLTSEASKKFFGDESAMLDTKLKVDLGSKSRTGNNVLGVLDNGSKSTIIIGAHYDHLGYGEDGNSMLRTNEHLIHNGADDNASGVASMIELARMLKASKNKKSNFLFIAFSGEELGLNGSKYYTEHPSGKFTDINYMVNMDMVGRLNDSSKAITIGGYGTSPQWPAIFAASKEAKNFSIKIDSSGSGPSDHTSFYRKDLPVLFFFTGLHSDYHRPTDDANKINYKGTWMIVKLADQVILQSLNSDKLAFTKTREQQTGTSTRFTVSLGIMPDYTFSGAGVRVDGVSSGRSAEKIGMKTGDVIIQLGPVNVSSVESYMQALSKYKKGDKTTVKYKRGAETLESDIQF
jgi:aminopeptidase YwaD